MNFFPKSVRFVDPGHEATRQLAERAHAAGIDRIGVFVNMGDGEITTIAKQVGLDAIQLHGDESPDLVRRLRDSGLQIIRAIRLPRDLSLRLIQHHCEPWIDLGCHLLLDARTGGSGECLDWAVVGRWAETNPEITWTLAGGLNETNVAEAIKLSAAKSVDTASGVESSPGMKSAERIEKFVQASQLAFAKYV